MKGSPERNETGVGGDYVLLRSQKPPWLQSSVNSGSFTTGCIFTAGSGQSQSTHGTAPSMMHGALCCCSTRCYHTQSSETTRVRHRTGTLSRSEHDQKRERWSVSSLPAVSIRLLTVEGYQRQHVDTNTRDPTPVRGQIRGEKAP